MITAADLPEPRFVPARSNYRHDVSTKSRPSRQSVAYPADLVDATFAALAFWPGLWLAAIRHAHEAARKGVL